MDDALAHRLADQCGSIWCAELLEKPSNVPFHGAFTDSQPRGDLLCAASDGNKLKYTAAVTAQCRRALGLVRGRAHPTKFTVNESYLCAPIRRASLDTLVSPLHLRAIETAHGKDQIPRVQPARKGLACTNYRAFPPGYADPRSRSSRRC